MFSISPRLIRCTASSSPSKTRWAYWLHMVRDKQLRVSTSYFFSESSMRFITDATFIPCPSSTIRVSIKKCVRKTWKTALISMVFAALTTAFSRLLKKGNFDIKKNWFASFEAKRLLTPAPVKCRQIDACGPIDDLRQNKDGCHNDDANDDQATHIKVRVKESRESIAAKGRL